MSIRALKRILMLAVASAVIPACGGSDDESTPPVLMRATPAFDANGVAHYPLIVLEFSKAMNPATFSGNIVLYLTDLPGNPTVPAGVSYSFIYIPGTFQTVMALTSPLAADTEYAVMVFSGLQAADGAPIQVSPIGGLALRFVAGNNANTNQPAFAPPVQVVGGVQGEIVWQWTQAQENAANITATYDFYGSTTAGVQDLLAIVPFASRTENTGFTMTGLTPNTTYYFRVICRDAAGNLRVTSEFQGTANP